MSAENKIEARRTAIAIVRAHLDDDRPAALALLSGTEDPGEVLSALVAFTGELVQVLGGAAWPALLDRLAISAALDD